MMFGWSKHEKRFEERSALTATVSSYIDVVLKVSFPKDTQLSWIVKCLLSNPHFKEEGDVVVGYVGDKEFVRVVPSPNNVFIRGIITTFSDWLEKQIIKAAYELGKWNVVGYIVMFEHITKKVFRVKPIYGEVKETHNMSGISILYYLTDDICDYVVIGDKKHFTTHDLEVRAKRIVTNYKVPVRVVFQIDGWGHFTFVFNWDEKV